MITKVKHSKGETLIRWRDVRQEDTVEHEMTSSEDPRPELLYAMAAFIPYVIKIGELPKEYVQKLTITGISFAESVVDEIEVIGIVVTAQKKLDSTPGPMILNTPFLTDPGWPPDVQELVGKLEEEAVRFRKGDRSQYGLPLPEATKKGRKK